MKKLNISIILFLLVFSGCSTFGETIRLNNYIFDNITTNYTTYSSEKIENLISNISVNGTGGNVTNNYYLNGSLIINESIISYYNNSNIAYFTNYATNGTIINTTLYYNSTHLLYAIENTSGTIKTINLTYLNNSITRVTYN